MGGGGGTQSFLPFEKRGGGAQKVVSCLEERGAKSFGPAIFPFCRAPFPVINDQSHN